VVSQVIESIDGFSLIVASEARIVQGCTGAAYLCRVHTHREAHGCVRAIKGCPRAASYKVDQCMMHCRRAIFLQN